MHKVIITGDVMEVGTMWPWHPMDPMQRAAEQEVTVASVVAVATAAPMSNAGLTKREAEGTMESAPNTAALFSFRFNVAM